MVLFQLLKIQTQLSSGCDFFPNSSMYFLCMKCKRFSTALKASPTAPFIILT